MPTTSPFPARFEDEDGSPDLDHKPDPDADLADDPDEEYDVQVERLRARRAGRAELDALRAMVVGVASTITDAACVTGRASTQLRDLLAQARAEEALGASPGMLSARLDALRDAVMDLAALFPSDEPEPESVEPTPAPAKKSKR